VRLRNGRGHFRNSITQNCVVLLTTILLVTIFLLPTESPHPGAAALAVVLCTAVLIDQAEGTLVGRVIFANKASVFIGLISYSLYLWHWPILSFSTTYNGELLPKEVRFAIIPISIFLASITYQLVERPIKQQMAWSPPMLFVLMFPMFILVLASVAIYTTTGLPNRPYINGQDEAAFGQLVAQPKTDALNDNCLLQYPFDIPDGASHFFCVKSDEEEPTILLLGNSFANHHYFGLSSNERLRHHVILSMGVCNAAFPPTTPTSDYISDIDHPCAYSNKMKEQAWIYNSASQSNSLGNV